MPGRCRSAMYCALPSSFSSPSSCGEPSARPRVPASALMRAGSLVEPPGRCGSGPHRGDDLRDSRCSGTGCPTSAARIVGLVGIGVALRAGLRARSACRACRSRTGTRRSRRTRAAAPACAASRRRPSRVRDRRLVAVVRQRQAGAHRHAVDARPCRRRTRPGCSRAWRRSGASWSRSTVSRVSSRRRAPRRCSPLTSSVDARSTPVLAGSVRSRGDARFGRRDRARSRRGISRRR